MRVIFVLSLFLIGCAKPKVSNLDVSIKNTTLKPYIDQFYVKASQNKVSSSSFLQIELGYDFNDGSFFDNNSTTIAICKIEDKKGVIRVNPNYWKNINFTELDKQIVFDHELGHCLLGLVHDDSKMTTTVQDSSGGSRVRSIPTSIMTSIHLGIFFSWNEMDWLAEKMDSYYLPKLFGKGNISAFSKVLSESSQTFQLGEEGCEHHSHLLEEMSNDK